MTRRRRLLFAVVLLALLVVPLVLAVAYAHSVARRGWQPALMIDRLDCSVGETCRMRAGTQVEKDATGRTRKILINSKGFRGRPFPTGEEPAHLLVAVFGDSVIFGTGVEDTETLPVQLERELATRLGVPVAVLNVGIPMNYLSSSLANLRRHVAPLEPDALVFALQGPDVLELADANELLMTLRESLFLQWLRKDADGVAVVNEWLRLSTRTPGAMAARRTKSLAALRDAVGRANTDDVPVVLFDYWRTPQLGSAFLTGELAPLSTVAVTGEMTLDEYRNSPRCIVGDGHPTPEGHRVYAMQLADALEPGLKRRIERGLRAHPPAP